MNTMVSPFELVATKLGETGFYVFFVPWAVTTAILWGLLKKSQMFSDSVNAIISISLSFLVWAYLIGPSSVAIADAAAVFMMQAGVLLAIFIFALIGSSMFYPEMTKFLIENFTSRSMFFIILALLFTLFFTSGLYNVLAGPESEEEPPEAESDVNAMIVIVAVLIITMGILAASARMGGE